MDCDRAGQLLHDYLDHTLDDDCRAELEVHATRCPRCDRLLNAYREILDAAAGRPTPPDGVVDRVMQTVASTPRPKRRRRRWWMWVAAAVVLLLVVGRLARRRPGPLVPTGEIAADARGMLETVGGATSHLAEAGRDLLAPVTPPPVQPADMMANLFDSSQSLLDKTQGGLLTGVEPFGRSMLESFGFLWSVPESALTDGSSDERS